jgi:hypothetical protein
MTGQRLEIRPIGLMIGGHIVFANTRLKTDERNIGIVSFDLEMAGDRFTLFRGSSVREGAEVPRNEQETAFSVHLGGHSARKV